jgi:hypothetical protein
MIAVALAPTKPTKDSICSSHLGNLRRSFLRHHLEQRPMVEMLQYGSVTLIHNKLDSWIDEKPASHNFSVLPVTSHDGTTGVIVKLDDASHDHLSRRVMSLSKRRSKLARSWSGNIGLIQKDSLIDILPSKQLDHPTDGDEGHHDGTGRYGSSKQRRSKPRRVSGHGNVLLDGGNQAVRKAILESKLSQRPLLANHDELDSTQLVKEITRRLMESKRGEPICRRSNPQNGAKIPLRTRSMDIGFVVRRQPRFIMPTGA